MQKNKFKNFIKTFFFLAVFFMLPNFASATPSISSAPATISDGQSVTIEGSGFGTKPIVAPIEFTNFDAETVGQVPVGWLSPQGTDCLINNSVYRGSKSLDCSAVDWPWSEYFPRVTLDMGRDIGTNNYLYFTLWLYMSNPEMEFNWKGPLLTSSTTPTYWQIGETNNNATGVGAWWSQDETRWFNTSITIQYSQDGTAAGNYCTNGNGAASDSYLFGQWQRLEYTIKTSSSPTVNDGFVKVERIGKSTPATNATGCITHGNTSDPWRFFSLPQGITNIPSTPFSMQMDFDDLYIDNNLSRAELCDSATWSSRTHCEIQKPTAWSDTENTITINQGSFAGGSSAYLFVVDENGDVNSDGFAVTLAAQSDTTAPSAPSGLFVM